jgi:hypothetical protein
MVQIKLPESGFVAPEQVLWVINVNRLIRCQGIYDRRPAGAGEVGKAVAQTVNQIGQTVADECGFIHG